MKKVVSKKQLEQIVGALPDGTRVVVSINAAPLLNSASTAASVVLSLRDVTELKKAEEELKLKSLLLDSALDSIIVHDLEGRMLYVNEAAFRTRGYTKEELMSMPLQKLVTPEYAESVKPVIDSILKTGSAVYESAHLKKDGTVMPVEVDARVVEFEGRKLIVNIMRDITEHKRIEEALKEREANLAEAQHVAHMGSWDWNLQTNELSWSDEIYRIFGTSPEEFGGTYGAYLSFVHPDDREFVKRSVNGALYEGKPYSIDHRIILLDGTERIVHEQAEVVRDKAGKPIRMVGTIQDITERKRAEETLERRRQLEKQIYADAIAAVTGGRFMLSSYDQIRQYARGKPVFSQFVAKPEEIYPVRAFIDAFLTNRGMSLSRRCEIEFAAVEALTNSVKHAGGGRIEIRVNNVLQIEVADKGPGINFATLPRSVLMLGFSTKGTLGFGFTIMLEFTNHLYLATGPAGTTIILEFQ